MAGQLAVSSCGAKQILGGNVEQLHRWSGRCWATRAPGGRTCRPPGRPRNAWPSCSTPREAQLLVGAATLHDIGYAPQIAHTGFHPLDGALYLRTLGYPPRLVNLVAHHSQAVILAHDHGIDDLETRFPREDSLLADALVYSDMHSSPEGTIIDPQTRLDPHNSLPTRVTGLVERGPLGIGGFAVWDLTDGRLIQTSGEVWRCLSWQVREADGRQVYLPLDHFGRVT